MHRAVADGPNHSPGCLPQAAAPCSTNRWMENGADESSANKDSSSFSRGPSCPIRQSLPNRNCASALASKLCPLLIIQPHPVSLVNPPWLPSCLSLVEKDMALVALGSDDLAIEGKLERYVSHILDSTSSRKAAGQPLAIPSSLLVVSGWSTLTKLSTWSLSLAAAESTAKAGEVEAEVCEASVLPPSFAVGMVWDSYRCPRHQIGA